MFGDIMIEYNEDWVYEWDKGKHIFKYGTPDYIVVLYYMILGVMAVSFGFIAYNVFKLIELLW